MVLADSLSRLPKQNQDEMINLQSNVSFIQFSAPKLQELREATLKDENLVTLIQYVLKGFPEKRRDLPKIARDYWSFRDQISIEDGILIKGEQIIIPASMRKEFIHRIHEGHQGITRCQQRARTCIYWPGINHAIEETVRNCNKCQTFQSSQTKEPMDPVLPDVPHIPWHTLGTDMFRLNGRDYLIIADYHSKFPIFLKKKVFALFGVPNKIISDNGPQFIGHHFQDMMTKFGITHVTSSPVHPKSHGFIESAVKTAKSLIRKSPDDISTALLLHRTTPIGTGLPSPAEQLFNRQISHNLPVHIKSHATDHYREKMKQHGEQMAAYHDQHSAKLPDLQLNQPIFYQDVAKKSWTPGKIIGYGPEPWSYTIECGITGRRLRRNRVLVRPRQVTFHHEVERQQYIPRTEGKTVGKTSRWSVINNRDHSMNRLENQNITRDGNHRETPPHNQAQVNEHGEDETNPPPVSPVTNENNRLTDDHGSQQLRRSSRHRQPPVRFQQ